MSLTTDIQLISLGLPVAICEKIDHQMGRFPLQFSTWQDLQGYKAVKNIESSIIFCELGQNIEGNLPETWAVIYCEDQGNNLFFTPVRPVDTPLAALLNAQFKPRLPRSAKSSTTPLRQLEMVNEVSRNISTLHDVREILTSITDELLDRFGYYHASVGVIENHDIVMYEATPRSRAAGPGNLFRLKVNDRGTLPWVARSGETRLVHDTRKDEIWVPGAGLEASRSELTVPMKLHGEILGIIDIQSEHPNAFDETDLWLIESLASQLAVALRNATLVQELSHRAEEVSTLLETSKSISAALPDDTRFSVIVQQARDLFNADNVVLFTLEEDQQLLRPLAAIHSYLNAVMRSPLKVGEGLTGKVVEQGVGMIVNFDDDEQQYMLHQVPDTPVEPECLISVPLRLESRILGAITIIRESKTRFNSEHLHLLEGFASLVAIGLNNASLVELNMKQRERAEALNRVARSTSAILNLNEVLKTSIEMLPAFALFDTAIIGLIKNKHLEIVQQSGYGSLTKDQLRVDLNELPVIQQIVETQELKVINDAQVHSDWHYLAISEHIRSWIGVPLVSHGITIGVLTVSSSLSGFYTEQNGQELLSFADQIALAIDNAQLYQSVIEREKRATTLHEVTRHLTLLDARIIPITTLQYLARGMPFHVGVVLLTGKTEEIIWYKAPDISEDIMQNIRQNLIQTFRDNGQPFPDDKKMVERIVSYPMVSVESPVEKIEGSIVTPLMSGRQTIGLLALYHVQANIYDQLDIRTVNIAANTMATALENAWLIDELKARAIYLQRAYDELAEIDRMKDELIQNVSHELRTPLTFIKGYVELFLEDGLGPLNDMQREKLHVVANKTDTLIRLVGDIVSARKLDRSNLELTPVQIADLIAQTVAIMMPTIQQEKREIIVDIAPGLPAVMGDSDRLSQILNNLIMNALKFSPIGSPINIRAFINSKKVRVEVEDYGIGIDKIQQERIFERFYQADGTTRRRYGGVGLGLAISRQIVLAHEGSIGVESTVGQGSCFYFELPVLEEPTVDVPGADI